MQHLSIRIWRDPPREEIRIDGQLVAHDVVVELTFENVPETTTLGDMFAPGRYFDHLVRAERHELQHPQCPSCRCVPEDR